MTETLYISEQIIKELSVLQNDVDPSLISPSIVYAQDCNIIPALGSVLHAELQLQLSSSTLTTLNQTLIEDYIQKAHIAWTLYYCQFDLLVKQRNRSLTTNSAEYAQPVEEKLLIRAEQKALNKAEFYSERLTNYLEANTDIYPSYLLSTGKSDNVYPSTNNYFSGIYLPDVSCECDGQCNCKNCN